MVAFKDRLRFLRESTGKTQIEVASELNIKSGTYSSYENGIVPKTDKIAMLAKYFDVSMDYILGITNERKPVGDEISSLIAELFSYAKNEALEAADFINTLKAAIEYYRSGAPAGHAPTQALRAYLHAMVSVYRGASSRSSAHMMHGISECITATSILTRLPASYYDDGTDAKENP